MVYWNVGILKNSSFQVTKMAKINIEIENVFCIYGLGAVEIKVKLFDVSLMPINLIHFMV